MLQVFLIDRSEHSHRAPSAVIRVGLCASKANSNIPPGTGI
jgi:hypothetical protein